MPETDRKLIEDRQRRRRSEAERIEAAEEEIRMLVERIPVEAKATLAVIEELPVDKSGAVLKTVDQSRHRFGRTKRRGEEKAAWRLCSIGYGNDGGSTYYWLLSDGMIAMGDSTLYVQNLAEDYATDVKHRSVPGWNAGERSSTWAAIRGVHAALLKLRGKRVES